MPTRILTVEVRHVPVPPDQEARLRHTVAELQAVSILRSAKRKVEPYPIDASADATEKARGIELIPAPENGSV